MRILSALEEEHGDVAVKETLVDKNSNGCRRFRLSKQLTESGQTLIRVTMHTGEGVKTHLMSPSFGVYDLKEVLLTRIFRV